MMSPLLEAFGYLENDIPAQQVINGTYIAPVGTSDYVEEFLEVLGIPDSIEELGMVDLHLDTTDNKSGWKE